MQSIDMMVADYRREQLQREADAQRLANEVSQQSQSNPMLAALGRQMVKLGEHLQNKFSEQPQHELRTEMS